MFGVRFCLLELSEAISMKSYQQGCLNMSWAGTTSTHMLTWVGEISLGLSPTPTPVHTGVCTGQRLMVDRPQWLPTLSSEMGISLNL